MPIVLGNTTITGLGVGGLPDGTVNADDLASGAVTAAKMGYAGAILQTVENRITSTSSATNSDWNDMWTANITRTSTSSKILHCSSLIWSGDNPNGYWNIQRSFNNSTWTTLFRPFEADEGYGSTAVNGNPMIMPLSFLDDPGTTNAQVYYRVQWIHSVRNGGTMYRNRVHTLQGWSTTLESSWTLMEIK
jgi:hypothetical protein